MNTIEFILKDYRYGMGIRTEKGVDIYIDGKNLINIVRETELPFAEKAGESNMAGRYCGIIANQFFEYFDNPIDNYTCILGCGCGCVECWPIEVQITKNEHVIVWQNFSNYHLVKRQWNWLAMPVFTFDIQQYNAEVEKLRQKITNINNI